MSNARAWLFRVLVLVSGGLLLYSWFMPWWSVFIPEWLSGAAIVIHPFGLEVLEEQALLFVDPAASKMPVWFTPTMWAYLGIVIAALLFSLWAKDKELKLWKVSATLPSLAIGIAGFSYIVVLVTAVIVATIKTGDVYTGINLIGTTTLFQAGESASVEAGLRLGYWLAWGAGLSLIVLALLRNKIIGKRYP